MDEFKKIIFEYGLTVDDFTEEEIREVLKELEFYKNNNGEFEIFDGILSGTFLAMKQLEKEIKLKEQQNRM